MNVVFFSLSADVPVFSAEPKPNTAGLNEAVGAGGLDVVFTGLCVAVAAV